MPLDPRLLLTLRQVLRAGSISAAARELGWTQPAVSQQLARLERQAGGPLLLRGPGGVRATEAGELLRHRADILAGELHAAEEELAALTQLRGGVVRLVAFPSAAATLVPTAMAALADQHRDIEVRLSEGEPPEALLALESGDADLAVIFGYDGPPSGLGRLEWRFVADEAVHLVLPIEGIGPRRLADLRGADWIGGCVRCRTHLVERCEAAGFEPAIRHTTDDYVVVQNLVARGLGVTVLPESALAAYRHPGVRTLPLAELGRRHVGLAYRPGADRVPATAAMITLLRSRP